MRLSSAVLSMLVCLSHASLVLAGGQKASGLSDLTVRVKTSGGPVEGATVVLTSQSAGQRVNVTNAEGVCEFRALRAGTYSLQVVQRSFFPSEDSESQLKSIEIRDSQSQSVDFHLVKGGVLKGRVVSVEGSPIIGLPISALKLMGAEPSHPPTKESNSTAISDDRGEFRIYGLRPGSYTVAVNAQRGASPVKSFPTLFYPGEKQLANATNFEVLRGEEVTMPEMVLDLSQTMQTALSGVVHGVNGKPLKAVSLSLISVDSQLSDSTFSDEQGHFDFEGLSSGQYVLKASLNSQGYFNFQREVSIKDLAANNVKVDLKPFPVISGRAFLRNGTVLEPLPSLRLELEPAASGKSPIGLRTNKNGAFSHRVGEAGAFWWTFPDLQGDYFVNRILVDGKDITNESLKLDGTSDLSEISFELSTGAAEIQGIMPNRSCLGNLIYVIALHAKRNEIQTVRKANCSADAFRIQSLAPGQYYVLGILDADNINQSRQGSHTKKQGVTDQLYNVIEKVVVTLQTRGTKPLALDRDQISKNTRVIMIDSVTGAPIQ